MSLKAQMKNENQSELGEAEHRRDKNVAVGKIGFETSPMSSSRRQAKRATFIENNESR